MPDVYCIRAKYGMYAEHFVKGGYVAIGYSLPERDLSDVQSREEIYALYKETHPEETSNLVIGQQVGQIARFLLEIKAGDYVVTPPADTERLHYGVVEPGPSYYHDGSDGCPFLCRRRVKWEPKQLKRSDFSVPFQNTIRSSLTVFSISQKEHFFETIGDKKLVSQTGKKSYDPYGVVLGQLLELDATEFEVLVTHLLTALGFEGSEHTGRSGDGGVDAIGELDVSNLAKVKVFVQVKRYGPGKKIDANTVKALRQSIPAGGQGAFITTADFQAKAKDIAVEQGFPRIGLVNGRQLVDLLVEHWEDIPQEFQDKLALKQGLVRA